MTIHIRHNSKMMLGRQFIAGGRQRAEQSFLQRRILYASNSSLPTCYRRPAYVSLHSWTPSCSSTRTNPDVCFTSTGMSMVSTSPTLLHPSISICKYGNRSFHSSVPSLGMSRSTRKRRKKKLKKHLN